jgi:hypothetical protein
VKGLRQGIYKQGCHRFRPVPHIIQYTYINNTPRTPGVYLRLFADDTYIYIRQTVKRVMFSESCSEVSVCDLHAAFSLPYIYDYITNVCRQQAEVTQNHENKYVRSIGQAEDRHRKCKRLKLGGGRAYNRSSDQAAVVT